MTTLNSVFRKLWFSVFVATYIWIKSKVLVTGLWNFYHLFFFILSIFLGMESTLAKKVTTKFYFLFFGIFLFILIFYFIFNFFFSHVTLFPIPKKLLHLVRNKIRKESWKLVRKQKKLFKVKQKSYLKSKNVQKMQKNSKFVV